MNKDELFLLKKYYEYKVKEVEEPIVNEVLGELVEYYCYLNKKKAMKVIAGSLGVTAISNSLLVMFHNPSQLPIFGIALAIGIIGLTYGYFNMYQKAEQNAARKVIEDMEDEDNLEDLDEIVSTVLDEKHLLEYIEELNTKIKNIEYAVEMLEEGETFDLEEFEEDEKKEIISDLTVAKKIKEEITRT